MSGQVYRELVTVVADALRRESGRGLSDHDLARVAVRVVGGFVEVESSKLVLLSRLESAEDVRRLGRWLAGAPRCVPCSAGRVHGWHDNGDPV